jgi:hypothetical protein
MVVKTKKSRYTRTTNNEDDVAAKAAMRFLGTMLYGTHDTASAMAAASKQRTADDKIANANANANANAGRNVKLDVKPTQTRPTRSTSTSVPATPVKGDNLASNASTASTRFTDASSSSSSCTCATPLSDDDEITNEASFWLALWGAFSSTLNLISNGLSNRLEETQNTQETSSSANYSGSTSFDSDSSSSTSSFPSLKTAISAITMDSALKLTASVDLATPLSFSICQQQQQREENENESESENKLSSQHALPVVPEMAPIREETNHIVSHSGSTEGAINTPYLKLARSESRKNSKKQSKTRTNKNIKSKDKSKTKSKTKTKSNKLMAMLKSPKQTVRVAPRKSASPPSVVLVSINAVSNNTVSLNSIRSESAKISSSTIGDLCDDEDEDKASLPQTMLSKSRSEESSCASSIASGEYNMKDLLKQDKKAAAHIRSLLRQK